MPKKNAKAATTKAKAETTAAVAAPKKMSALDAAAKVLVEVGEAMNTKQMIDAMATKRYWTSPGGKTPHATLYSAILREIGTKNLASRFRKTTKGHFASMTDAPAPEAGAKPAPDAKPTKKVKAAKAKPAKKRGSKNV